ncbi:nitroreductase family deazaflavin-dependent oxidoreductase [Georgenia sp. 10Sc9-8]|uniref:Nitroreductase family deazaflavin-dependent oxidoreductase n=1 Tax=Georgenia halotolerans TaxID=3028317 RepID=A0ABT5U066_9MICO|nr:nitroreductase family deazaflavin-dependent oxidoreductase [Georgenia halotolerans]
MRRIPRRLARAPIGIFRVGLGWVFAGRLVMVEHVGRRTGRRRHVVLEVVERGPHHVVVPSGYGRRAQWFRNLEADPRVRLWWRGVVGARGHARVLGVEEARELLERYRARSRTRARVVATTLDLPELLASGPLPAEVAARVPLVELRSAALPGNVPGRRAGR